MAIPTNLYLNLTTERFVQSFQQPSDIGKPSWYYSDVKELRIQFFRNAAAGQGQVEVVPVTGISLQVGVAVSPGSSVLTSASASPAVDDIFEVTLPLNISSIVSAIGAAEGRDFTMEFLTTDASGSVQRYQALIRIRKNILTGAVEDPPPPDTGVTMAQVNAVAWPRVSEQGAQQIWTSDNGTQFTVKVSNAGAWEFVQLN